jgi:hypothetical protein
MWRRSAWTLLLTPVLAAGGLASATVSQAATQVPAHLTAKAAAASKHVKPNHVNQLDCNGYSTKYKPLNPASKMHCTDPIRRTMVTVHGMKKVRASRFEDNGHYIGHDEPSVKFESSARGSGNTMSYFVKLPTDPRKAPTPSGSVTTYGELSVAPWFGLPMCDPGSFPQNPCKPDSDSNTGLGAKTDAGSAFMELQFYPPGFAPFADSLSCSAKQWCAAMTIDSLEANFDLSELNAACEEPVNFAFLQHNGQPAGPPSPQLSNLASETPNGQTLKMNPGDVLKVSMTDPAAGFTTTVTDLTRHTSGVMVASAANGFMNTNIADCTGNPFTFHAEYSTAKPQNQVPWAALEGGVLMQQEIGHAESCNSVSNPLPISENIGGQSFSDPRVFQTCDGGSEGPHATGEGPCAPDGTMCTVARTEGRNGPVACPTNDANSGQLCEFSDGFCLPKGARTVMLDGIATKETSPLAFCEDTAFQNGDLDFDGTSYQPNTWPDGTANHPTAWRYLGPFDAHGHPYPRIQIESNVPASEILCNVGNGHNCDVKPLGSAFYPFWSLNRAQKIRGSGALHGACVWNFGNVLPGTFRTLGKDGEYGQPDVARFGGTSISPVEPNPAIGKGCTRFSI